MAARFTIQNIFNQPVQQFIDTNGNEKLDENNGYTSIEVTNEDGANVLVDRNGLIDNSGDVIRLKYKEGTYYTFSLSFVF